MLEIWMFQLRYEHCRYPEERRALFLVYGLQHLLGVEALDGDHRPLVGDGVQGAKHAAETVKERDRYTHPVFRPQPHALADVEGVLYDVGVGQLHTLRETRRPRGVLHVDDLFGVERRLPPAQLFAGDLLSPLYKLCEAHYGQLFGGIPAHEDDVLQEWEFLDRQLAACGPV